MTDLGAGRARLIELLQTARRTNERIDPAPVAPADLAAGYAIADEMAAARGATAVAWKIGATNDAAQALLNVAEPFAGHLDAGDLLPSPASVALSELAGPPVIEAEIGLRVDASGAVTEVVPCIEIACSRLVDMSRAGGPAIAADNGGAFRLVVGTAQPAADIGDLREIRAALDLDGERQGEGSGADVLGDPANAVAWLRAHLADRGAELADGSLVSTGALAMVPGAGAGTYVADFGVLGQVELDLRAD